MKGIHIRGVPYRIAGLNSDNAPGIYQGSRPRLWFLPAGQLAWRLA